jgi:hypothetical protein
LENSGIDLFEMLYLGYLPQAGRSYEATAGSSLFMSSKSVISKMDNPKVLPMFYYDPTSSKFVFTIRRQPGTGAGHPLSTMNPGSNAHPWLMDSPQGVSGDWTTRSITGGLPLQAHKGSSLYTLESSTQNLISHYVVHGVNRVTGAPLKTSALNPNWNALKGNDNWGDVFGHTGYRGKAIHDMGGFVTDTGSARRFAHDAMWWMMRPTLVATGMTVKGVIFFGGGGAAGGLYDGTIGLILGTDVYRNALVESSSIRYDAEEQTVESTVSAHAFPTFTG